MQSSEVYDRALCSYRVLRSWNVRLAGKMTSYAFVLRILLILRPLRLPDDDWSALDSASHHCQLDYMERNLCVWVACPQRFCPTVLSRVLAYS
jgi:hypothetical protein